VDPNKDYYAILGVLPEAEAEVIRAVYLALSKKYHPDSNDGSASNDRQREINEAYEILSDPKSRGEYDATKAERSNTTGDYEPEVDDEDLSVDDYQDDWNLAVQYY
jgi:curved DNA-binding protein